MIANLLKYTTVRLAAAFFIFLFAGYTAMYTLHEQVGAEKHSSFLWITIAFFSFLLPSVSLSYIGRLRFNGFLLKASKYELPLTSKKAVNRFERLLLFSSSFYFFPTTTEKLLSQAYREYSKLYLGLHARSRAAQEIYEETIRHHPGDSNIQKILLNIYIEKEHLSKKEIATCFRIFKHSPGNRKAIEILADTYAKNNVFDFDSQEIFTQAIELNTPAKEKVIDYLVLKLIELQRKDDFAAKVYLAAYSDCSNKSEAVIEAIIKLARDRREKGRKDELSQKIFEIYEGIPGRTRNDIEKQFKIKGKEKLPARPSLIKFVKELLSGIYKNIFKLFEILVKLLINISQNLRASKVFQLSLYTDLVKNRPYLFSFSIGLVALFLIVFIAFQDEKDAITSLDLSDINPDYKVLESELPYSIQVAAFKSLQSVERVIDKLSDKGERAYYTKPGEETAWYRVRVGEFKTRKEAKQYGEKLLKSKLIKGYFITNFKQGFIKINEK